MNVLFIIPELSNNFTCAVRKNQVKEGYTFSGLFYFNTFNKAEAFNTAFMEVMPSKMTDVP